MPSKPLSRPGWHARSWTISGNVKFWDEKVTQLLAETEHLLPCSPKELTRALAEAGWPKAMASNALAHADGRRMFFRGGLWWPVRRSRT